MLLIMATANQAMCQAQVQNQTGNQKMSEQPNGNLNWKTRTMGGMQFWSDVHFTGGFKIQRNSKTGHHRLVDPSKVRLAWGNLAHCHSELNDLIAAGKVPANRGKFVIALHGLMRTNLAMEPIATYLREQGGYTVVNFQYASSREVVATHAKYLRTLVDGLGDGVTEINFVGHSLGNIVVRHYLGDIQREGHRRDQRIYRMVMLGPPNQGSRMARILKNSFLFKTIAGASGAQLSVGWEHLEASLATPEFEFGIVAGAQAQESDLSNFVLRGKDDFTVSVDETKLAGAHDMFIQPLLHSTMMKQSNVMEAMLRFFQHGYFETEQARKPVSSDWKPEKTELKTNLPKKTSNIGSQR